ncbi:MAG TPA: universal stress protein, partial [Cytophagaceae bacterium]|nr:universal stress protein [Cytophagaceae bacterium]
MKKILVLTDFSKCSDNAVRYAIQFSQTYQTDIIFYHSFFKSLLNDIEVIQKNEKDKLELLKQHISNLYHSVGIMPNNDHYMVRFGTHLTDNLEEIVRRKKIDLILTGTEKATEIERFFKIPNTSKIIDRIGCPVLSIPSNNHFKLIKKIILFSDLTDLSLELEDALPIAKQFNCQLSIYHLV